MLLAVCLLLCSDSTSYSGRDRQLDVRIPRLEAEVVTDGDLSDSVWAHAARLTGFSQYSPNDGVPAADSTQVLVWYSASAIYFGIRAFEQRGGGTGATRLESRLRVPIARSCHRLGIRSRDAHSIQEHPVSGAAAAGLV